MGLSLPCQVGNPGGHLGKRRVQRDLEFGRRLKQAMSAEDMEAGKLAELEGVGDGTVSRWRKGELPNDLRLPRLAGHLRVREEWLRTGQEPMRAAPNHNGVSHAPMTVREPPASTPTAAEIKALVSQRLAEWRRSGVAPPDWEVMTWLDLAMRARRSGPSG